MTFNSDLKYGNGTTYPKKTLRAVLCSFLFFLAGSHMDLARAGSCASGMPCPSRATPAQRTLKAATEIKKKAANTAPPAKTKAVPKPPQPDHSYKKPLPPEFFDKRCEGFIDSRGEYGPWGKIVVDYVNSSEENRRLFHKAKFSRLGAKIKGGSPCPAFDSSKGEKKDYAIVALMAALAHKESSCDPNARGPKFDSVPVGLFQVPELSSGAKSVDANIKYAMDKISAQLKRLKSWLTGPKRENKVQSYFEPLRRPEHERSKGFINALRSLPICGAKK